MQEQAKNQKKDGRNLVQRMRVPLGFVTAFLFVVSAQPTWRSLALGLPLALLGAAVRGWASGHLRKNAELATSGPYAYTRNPLYFGSFVMALGIALTGGKLWLVVWLTVFYLLIYWPTMQAEAVHMRTLFAESYERWAAHVPLFWPRLTPHLAATPRSFDWQQYRHHREYRALFGVLLVIGLLALKVATQR